MCGIIGIIGNDPYDFIIDATKSIRHRGPDDSGTYFENNVGLGFRRLAIQDLSHNGHQPMISEDGNYIIIFNGEIYNHNDIREKLQTKYTFKSTSDTETLLNGYIEYGAKILNLLNGIFAFTIYDRTKKELFIARDNFGIKPLYYYLDKQSLIWGSEIKSFLSYQSFDSTLDYTSLVNYITLLWSPGEATPFVKVKKLLPGHFIRVKTDDLNSLEIVKYYDINFTGNYSKKTEEELIEELDTRLFNAVKRQLLSDVPVGFFLSGGLDSSAIVAMAKRINPDLKLNCYTIDSGLKDSQEGFSDDLHYAQIVAKHLDVNLKVVNGSINILKEFDKMIYHLDEPQADIAPLHVYNICKQARQDGIIVLLGGTAGDDLFSGYRRHQALFFEKYIKWIPNWSIYLVKGVLKKIKTINAKIRRLKKVLNEIKKTKIERMIGYFSWISLDTAKSLISENHQSSIINYNPQDVFKKALLNIPKEKNDLNLLLYLELKYFLCDHNLNYTDKMSMATGVEVRVPFLDKELVEFSTTIPPHLKLKGTTTKYILKKVMEKYLPHEVIYRPKSGFGAPLRDWIINDLDEKIKASFTKERIDSIGIFDYEKVQELIKSNSNNEYDASYSVLSLLSIDSWYNQFKKEK
jgi:asparagine synthase (glutamine-hydrolysing)